MTDTERETFVCPGCGYHVEVDKWWTPKGYKCYCDCEEWINVRYVDTGKEQ